jgi:hypothetical protein
MMPAAPPQAPDEPLHSTTIGIAALNTEDAEMAFHVLMLLMMWSEQFPQVLDLHRWRQYPLDDAANDALIRSISFRSFCSLIDHSMFGREFGIAFMMHYRETTPQEQPDLRAIFRELYVLRYRLSIVFDGFGRH